MPSGMRNSASRDAVLARAAPVASLNGAPAASPTEAHAVSLTGRRVAFPIARAVVSRIRAVAAMAIVEALWALAADISACCRRAWLG